MFWTRIPTPPSRQEQESLRHNPAVVEAPDSMLMMMVVQKILGGDLGFIRSQEQGLAVLGNGDPVPMWSFGCVEYLMGINLSALTCLELGAGQSTSFLSPRVKSICAVETDPKWAETMREKNLKGVDLHAVPADQLPAWIRNHSQTYDIISIDPAANRLHCAKEAAPKLNPGGFIVLDNSEWYPNTSAFLRSQGLIQVDYHDFRALHLHRTVTSLFLHPDFRPVPLGRNMPLVPIGGKGVLQNGWDQ